MPFARTWMDLKNVILTEVTQSEKDKCHMISVISVILKMVQMNLFTKQKWFVNTDVENKCTVTKGAILAK